MKNPSYIQPKLPYAPDALEPAISQETVNFHYGKHEKAYIDNLNKLIEGTEYADMDLEDIITKSEGALFNNASQAWNHIFYFFAFSPDGGGEPAGRLRKAIDEQFGSFENFKKNLPNREQRYSEADGYGFHLMQMVSFSLLRNLTPAIR